MRDGYTREDYVTEYPLSIFRTHTSRFMIFSMQAFGNLTDLPLPFLQTLSKKCWEYSLMLLRMTLLFAITQHLENIPLKAPISGCSNKRRIFIKIKRHGPGSGN